MYLCIQWRRIALETRFLGPDLEHYLLKLMPSIFRSFFICLKCVCSKFQVVSWIERLWSVGQKIPVFGSCDHDRTSYNVDFRIPLANFSHHLAGLFLRRVSHRLLSLLQLNHPQKDTSFLLRQAGDSELESFVPQGSTSMPQHRDWHRMIFLEES